MHLSRDVLHARAEHINLVIIFCQLQFRKCKLVSCLHAQASSIVHFASTTGNQEVVPGSKNYKVLSRIVYSSTNKSISSIQRVVSPFYRASYLRKAPWLY